MRKFITIATFLFLTFQTFGQNYKYVTTETLNVREQAGKNYSVVGQINKGDRIITITESNGWTEIETSNGVKGFVASKYLSSESPTQNSNTSKEKSPWVSVLIVLGILVYAVYKVKNFFSGLFGGGSKSSSSSRSQARTGTSQPKESRSEKLQPKPKQKYICKHCGYENENLGSLTFFSCQRSPTKKHQPLEGGVQEMYSCKHCGYQNKNLGSLTFFSCSRSPTGKHQPLS